MFYKYNEFGDEHGEYACHLCDDVMLLFYDDDVVATLGYVMCYVMR